MRAKQTAGAFTLIEIMIVVAIMGMLLSMGIPPVARALQKQGMAKALGDLTDAIAHARAAAILGGSDQVLTLHPLDLSVEAPGFANTKFPDGIYIDILDVNFIQFEREDVAQVKFRPNGTCDEFTIVLRSNRGEMEKISMDVVTARPEIVSVR